MEDSFCDGWTSLTLGDEADVQVDIRPLPTKDGMLIKIQPPCEPKPQNAPPNYHVSADIVLVIDVSTSMQAEAPAPADAEQVAERFGLSVLDLVKHASMTILETLDQGDRLGIVTFSSTVKVLQPLTVMTTTAKERSAALLKGLCVEARTNMWHGVNRGLELFRTAQDGGSLHRVPALMLLTDGMPNYMCPQQGWVPKLNSMAPLPAPIHSFGFGYHIKSGLLKSISELSGGHYVFIPDSGMIGTVFIHAVANLQSTAATEACLTIRTNYLQLKSPVGSTVCSGEMPLSEQDIDNSSIFCIKMSLGSIHFGQSRDLYMQYSRAATNGCIIEANLTFRDLSGAYQQITVQRSAVDFANIPAAEVAYHRSRSQICQFLSSLFPIVGPLHQHVHRLGEAHTILAQLKQAIAARRFPDDADCASLMADLEGPPPHGQISLALSSAAYQSRWGGHYLLGLLDAHASQACNTHKDEGPLRYGRDSPLFRRCRDALNAAFDDIEPPEPSINVLTVPPPAPPAYAPDRIYKTSQVKLRSRSDRETLTSYRGSRMGGDSSLDFSYESIGTHFNQRSNPCFAGSTMVALADGDTGGDGAVPISWLRAGMRVATPMGARAVQAILKTRVRGEAMVRLPGGVVVTPWHPVKAGDDAAQWAFPAEMCPAASAADKDGHATTTTSTTTAPSSAAVMIYSGFTYSLLLEAKPSPENGGENSTAAAEQHAFLVGSSGMWGVALGHGMVKGGDVRAHDFFGDRLACVRALSVLPGSGGGVATSAGLIRSTVTGKVVGFRMPTDDAHGTRAVGPVPDALELVAVQGPTWGR